MKHLRFLSIILVLSSAFLHAAPEEEFFKFLCALQNDRMVLKQFITNVDMQKKAAQLFTSEINRMPAPKTREEAATFDWIIKDHELCDAVKKILKHVNY